MDGTTEELAGDALKDRAAELQIEGRSQLTADELRDAVTEAEAKARGVQLPDPQDKKADYEEIDTRPPLAAVAEDRLKGGVVHNVPEFTEEVR